MKGINMTVDISALFEGLRLGLLKFLTKEQPLPKDAAKQLKHKADRLNLRIASSGKPLDLQALADDAEDLAILALYLALMLRGYQNVQHQETRAAETATKH
ncbi:hypothetical protein [Acetobacter orientalis]|uniref:hypothetical protein n=1 Tax=Acetobacter orientalis TaxID=146474 RepID=UPI00241EEB63|nr:hypothetical protein [Acetobacter orientalis]